MPLAVSLVLHAILLGALGTVAWHAVRAGGTDPAPTKDVYIAIAAPARAPAPKPEAPPARQEPAAQPPPPGAAPAPAGPLTATPAPKSAPQSAPSNAPTRAPSPGSDSSEITKSIAVPALGVTFAGMEAEKARSVCYVVDCSGPMVTTLPQVLAEVRRSIEQLEPAQKFNVVLFGDATGETGDDGADAPAAGAPRFTTFDAKLIDATPRAQGRLADWLAKATPGGRSNPLDGLRAGLALKPQVVFLLSRSIERSGGGAWGAGLKATLGELDQLNPADRAGRRKTIIKTIQFLEDDPTGTMQAIAGAHGGTGEASYRVLKRDELMRGR